MEYKGYVAKIEYDESASSLHGYVANSGPYSIANFYGNDVAELKREFAASVDAVPCLLRGGWRRGRQALLWQSPSPPGFRSPPTCDALRHGRRRQPERVDQAGCGERDLGSGSIADGCGR